LNSTIKHIAPLCSGRGEIEGHLGGARRRAITGLRNLGWDEDADRIEDLSAREYADEKGFEIVENPVGVLTSSIVISGAHSAPRRRSS
jgi:hypothetical protein